MSAIHKINFKQLVLLFASMATAFLLSSLVLYQSSNLNENELLLDPSRSDVDCAVQEVTICSTYTDRGLTTLVLMVFIAMPLFALTIAIVISNNRRFEKMLLIGFYTLPYLLVIFLSLKLMRSG